MIKVNSTSELLSFTIRHLLNQVHNQPEYLKLKGQHEQKKAQNNQHQQQLHDQYSSQPTTTAAPHQQHQVPNISCRNNFIGQKMTSWKLSSLLSTQTNQPNYTGKSV